MVNLTPHEIVVRTAAGDIVIPPSGFVARVIMEEEGAGHVAVGGNPEDVGTHVRLVTRRGGQVAGVPDSAGPFLVSSMVLDAIANGWGIAEPTQDSFDASFFAPDTGSTAIRNDKGHIVAVTQLVTF